MTFFKAAKYLRPRLVTCVAFSIIAGIVISWLIGNHLARLHLNDVKDIGYFETSSVPFVFIGACAGLLFGFAMESSIRVKQKIAVRLRNRDTSQCFNRLKKMLRCPSCEAKFETVQNRGRCPQCQLDFTIQAHNEKAMDLFNPV